MKTTIYYFLFFCILTIQSTFCQTIEQQDITGTWTVTQAMIDPKISLKEKEMMELMKKSLLNSTLQFKENGKFFITFSKEAPAFMDEMKTLNNKDWKFDKDDQLILTGNKEGNYNHLRLYVKKTDGKFLFAMSDAPIILEMVKK